MRYTLLIIDIQRASLGRPEPFFDAPGLIQRVSSLARRVRAAAGRVVFVQYTGPAGTGYHPDEQGWELAPDLEVEPTDIKVRKPGSDVFEVPELETILGAPDDNRLIVTGCDTEYCVDSAIRSALARGYDVTVPEDGHSLTDRRHLTASQIIRHHNAIWSTPGAFSGPLTVCKCSEILAEPAEGPHVDGLGGRDV